MHDTTPDRHPLAPSAGAFAPAGAAARRAPAVSAARRAATIRVTIRVTIRARLAAAALAAAVACGAAAAEEAARELALELVNAARQDAGLQPLALDDALVAAAQAHADDMLARDYHDHVSPEGETVQDRYAAAGGSGWHIIAENIATCRGCPVPPGPDRVQQFHDDWMRSEVHRENILEPEVDAFGFAMAAADEVTYAVQTFAGHDR